MKILLIAEEPSAANALRRRIQTQSSYLVEAADSRQSGFEMACNQHYVLIILDLVGDGADGCELCEKLRDRRVNTPILVLNPRDSARDRIRALDAGADDCLARPFDFDELLARVRALIRRDSLSKGRVIRIADLEIDTSARRVFRRGNELTLTRREYALLEALAANEGRILSREVIQYRIWNNEEKLSNTVDVYIHTLRKKVDSDRPVRLIRTVHGLGYMLKRPG